MRPASETLPLHESQAGALGIPEFMPPVGGGVSKVRRDNMSLNIALKVSDLDNVATIFANGITSGTQVESRDKKGQTETVTVIGDVPFGHKIAVRDIKKGELINKYGEEIGIATKDIAKGEYVHVHNLDSMRGRGDWKEKE